jgi:hypothetical protein
MKLSGYPNLPPVKIQRDLSTEVYRGEILQRLGIVINALSKKWKRPPN